MFSIGDLVQDLKVNNCKIVEVMPAKEMPTLSSNFYKLSKKEQDEYYLRYKVEYEDGRIEIGNQFSYIKRDTEVEREFRAFVSSVEAKINEKLDQAAKLIYEAENISEEYGIPFDSSVSLVGNTYVPESKENKTFPVSEDFFNSVTAEYTNEYGEFSGWQKSSGIGSCGY